MLEGLGQALLAEGQLSDGPDFRVRLQVLLDLRVQGASLEGNDFRGSIGVMRNGRTALGAEDPVDGFARRAFAGPFLGGAVDGELVFGDDGDERVGRAALALAVVAVVVAGDEGSFHVGGVGYCFAETVSCERHGGRLLRRWFSRDK